jgi:hypothetical protein
VVILSWNMPGLQVSCGAACCGAGAALASSWRLIRTVAIAMSRGEQPDRRGNLERTGNPGECLVRSDCTERLVLRRHDCETVLSSPGFMHT